MFRPPVDRPPPDTRDDEEKADVARVLDTLAADHPARLAHDQGVDTLRLTHMVEDAELSNALTEAFLAGRRRLFQRSAHFRP